MKLRADPIVSVLLLAAVVAGVVAWMHSDEEMHKGEETATPVTAVVANNQETGQLVFDEAIYDFGDVTEGSVIKHSFRFHNAGKQALRIVKTETSCGCTTMSSIERSYAPGEAAEMEVTIDTRGKKGHIIKTVVLHLEGNQQPTVEVSLTMNMVAAPHPPIEGVSNINADAKCKTCHLESGQGQEGAFLYHRVCWQCHGKKGEGAMARAFTDPAWHVHASDDYIKQRIRDGWVENGMPSFVKGVEPALSDAQIDSLLHYLRKLGGQQDGEAVNK